MCARWHILIGSMLRTEQGADPRAELHDAHVGAKLLGQLRGGPKKVGDKSYNYPNYPRAILYLVLEGG